MIYIKPGVFACIGVAAVSPLLLHGHPVRDCNPRIELCGLSEASYLPDEPAPEHAPALIFAPPVAGYTSTATGSALTRSLSPSPQRWRPLTALEPDEL
jgi:hypothetical protein